jgi:hypothetical protein
MDTIEVFYSYSHKDQGLRDELDTHLALLQISREDIRSISHEV